jgi:hypothetical protein
MISQESKLVIAVNFPYAAQQIITHSPEPRNKCPGMFCRIRTPTLPFADILPQFVSNQLPTMPKKVVREMKKRKKGREK